MAQSPEAGPQRTTGDGADVSVAKLTMALDDDVSVRYGLRRSADAAPLPVTMSWGAWAGSSRLAIEIGVALAEVYMKATAPLPVTSDVTL